MRLRLRRRTIEPVVPEEVEEPEEPRLDMALRQKMADLTVFGWRFQPSSEKEILNGSSFLAEKIVSLPGQAFQFVLESADTLEVLLARVEAAQEHLRMRDPEGNRP